MNDLRLLLVHHDDHSQSVLPKGLGIGAAGHAKPAAMGTELDGDYMWSLSGDKNDLSKQGYCVVAPEGKRGDRLLELVEPLITRRVDDLNRGLSDGEAEKSVEVIRAPTLNRLGHEPSWGDSTDWVKRHLEKPELAEEDIPYYRLILGDLHEVPLTIQQALTVNGLVGRLAFDQDEHYEAYVTKVLVSENRSAPKRWPDLSMYTVCDGTPETEELHRDLVSPVFEKLKYDFPLHPGSHDAYQHARTPPSRDELVRIARQKDSSVLFTLSHGTGAPRAGWLGDRDRQRQFQGSMSFGSKFQLCAEDIAEGAFLAGGVWFMNACFSAGTPGQSVYEPWLQRLVDIRYAKQATVAQVLHSLPTDNAPPFIAALPKAALAKPDGPLAFIGHIDLTWTYAFGDHTDDNGGYGKRIGVLQGVLNGLSKGHRFGACFHHLTHYRNATIASVFGDVVHHAKANKVMTNPKFLHLWMMSEDLRGYTLLGDPAARILARGREPWRSDQPEQKKQSQQPAWHRPQPALDKLERAIGYVLTGSPLAKEAQWLGVSESDLRRWLDTYRQGGVTALKRQG